MEPDEINPTFEASEESYNRICMTFVIIEPGKHGILETYSALSGKVIFAEHQRNGFLVLQGVDRDDVAFHFVLHQII